MLNGLGNSISLYKPFESDIYEDLIIENIQWAGVDVKYIIRERINPDTIFGESTLSDFNDAAVIEMYLSRMENYNNQGLLFTKFGSEYVDECTFIVSIKRFTEEIQGFEIDEPRMGDLIYVPFADSLWEIRLVRFDDNFFQFGRNYTYTLDCALYQYSHEEIEVEGPDEFNDNFTQGSIINSDPLKLILGLHNDIENIEYGGFDNHKGQSVDESKSIKQENDKYAWNQNSPFGEL